MVPSRSRPDSLLKCWHSVRDTSNATLLAYVDRDQRDLYAKLPANHLTIVKPGTNDVGVTLAGNPRFTIVTGPRTGPIHSINALCHAVRPGGGLHDMFPSSTIFTYLTDDSTIGPVGWDEYLIRTIDSFPNQIGVVSLDHGADYINFYALSTPMVEAVGFYAIPEANHAWYWDTAMELVGDATRIVYSQAKDVHVAHEVQITRDSTGMPDEDCRRFAHWCISERKRIIKSVRAVM